MVFVKSLGEIKANYESGAGVAPQRYKQGIDRTTNWQASATSVNAEQLYAQGVQKAIANQTRKKALMKVSDATWKTRAGTIGTARIGEGMRASSQKMVDGYAPIKSALEALTLPPRTSDPMSNIDNRLKPVVAAEIAAKEAALGI